jgi:O-antigen/teichoic acid export membrane protein
MNSLARRFTNAVQWNVGITLATFTVQLGITPIVARLLTPSDFGLFAIANVAFIIATLLGGAGMISAIIREPVLDREIMGSSILLSWLVAAGLAFIVALLAPLAAMAPGVENKHTVVGLVRMMALATFVSGLGAPAQAMMQRELRFRTLALTQFVAVVLGMGGTTIVLASLGHGPWSLAYGNLVWAAIICSGCWWNVRGMWSISWRRAHMIHIGSVGIQMTLLRILDGLWGQVPVIIAHGVLPSFDVGLYQRAQSLVDMGFQATCGRVSNVLFPVMASRQHEEAFLRELIPPLIGIYSLFLLPATIFVAATVGDIVELMLGPRWRSATGVLVVIMIAFTTVFVSQPASSLLEARGTFRPRIMSAGLGVVIVTACAPLLVTKYGLIGIAIAAVAAGVVITTMNFAAIVADLRIPARKIITWMIPAATTAGLLGIAMTFCSHFILPPTASSTLRLATMGAVAAGVVVAGFRLFIGRARRRVLSIYFSLGASWPTILVAKLLGLERRDASSDRSLGEPRGALGYGNGSPAPMQKPSNMTPIS